MGQTFENKIVLVTGAASGIGRATAQAFAREGADVVAVDWTKDALEEAVAEMNAAGGKVTAVKTDVSSSQSIGALFEMIEDRFGRLDVGANCAGITGPASFMADVEEEEFDRTIAVNLKGVWLCMRAELRMMMPKGAGAIVNIASTAGLTGARRATPYGAAKHGVMALTKTGALEYSARGIRINAVCPGPTVTGQTASIFANPKARDAMIGAVPIGRPADPSEIAAAVLWLASDAASFTTGAHLVVDGGRTAR